MTITYHRTKNSGVTRNRMTGCPLCGYEFGHMEPRWKHILDEHGPEDAGLSPIGVQCDDDGSLFDDLEAIPGGGDS